MNFNLIPPVRSTHIRQAANGVACTFQIVGICNRNWATTVLCHLSTAGHGITAGKASDLSAAFGCSACHDLIDRRDPRWEEHNVHFDFYKRRAIDRTLHMLLEMNVISIRGGGAEFASEEQYQQCKQIFQENFPDWVVT